MLLVSQTSTETEKRGIHTVEFILINGDRLKIIMSKRDLEEFNITSDSLDYSGVETKRMFWDILGRAKRSVGFSCDGERVMVRLYTSRDGGCEMFVSKLGVEEEYCGYCMGEIYDRKEKDFEIQKRRVAYSFEALEWLLTVCRRLADSGYSEDSSAYYDADGLYYLFLESPDTREYFKFDELSFISEYGDPQNTESTYGFLCEHGSVICSHNAVETLSVL